MSDDTSLDLTGVGNMAKAIPGPAWVKAVETACETFKQCVAPITATTAGTGRLITAKFDSLAEVNKIYAAGALAKAREKVKKSKKTPKEAPNVPIINKAIEECSVQTDQVIRELWVNLLAQEMIDGGVHPEFTNILSKLNAEDAHTLVEIAEKSPKTFHQKEFRTLVESLHSVNWLSTGLSLIPKDARATFTIEHLRNLHLIRKSGNKWILTAMGEEFIRVVSDPTSA